MQANPWRFRLLCSAAVRRGAHCPIEHIQGFIRSHWMLTSGECLCRLSTNSLKQHETLTKHSFYLATTYGTFREQLLSNNNAQFLCWRIYAPLAVKLLTSRVYYIEVNPFQVKWFLAGSGDGSANSGRGGGRCGRRLFFLSPC